MWRLVGRGCNAVRAHREQEPGRWWSGAASTALCLACHAPDPSLSEQPPLRIASTYTLDESGLFPVLSEEFTARTQRTLVPSFLGSGAALEFAKSGQADLVFAHSRPSEDAFVLQGYGINRRDVMYSEFAIVGPVGDPANIEGSSSAVEALARLARGYVPFVSRGDQSGTHVRELSLWKLAGVEPAAAWYTSAHAGMVATLVQASQRGAYTLSDLPTFLVHEQEFALKVLVRGDSRLHNAYGIMAANPARFPETDYAGAMAFIDFVTSPAGQNLIRDYGRERFGTSLFHPLVEPEGID